jgi:hypothetical protein
MRQVHAGTMNDTPKSVRGNPFVAAGLILLGIGLAAAGIYVGETDDAPGAALLGIVLAVGLVTLGIKKLRRGTIGSKS